MPMFEDGDTNENNNMMKATQNNRHKLIIPLVIVEKLPCATNRESESPNRKNPVNSLSLLNLPT